MNLSYLLLSLLSSFLAGLSSADSDYDENLLLQPLPPRHC